MSSWQPPTPEQVDRVLQLTTRPAEFRYFLDRLDNPEWVRVFYERGLFQSPIAPIVNAEEGTVQFPMWPLSRFAARVARRVHDSELLLLVADQMAQSTNVHVQDDVISVAVAMSAPESSKLARYVDVWLTAWHGSVVDFLIPALANWMRYLAAEGESKSALAIARSTLALKNTPGEEKKWRRTIVGRVGPYWYGEFLKSYPDLVAVAPAESISLLARVLAFALRSEEREQTKETLSGCLDDYSTIWRHDIASSEEWSREDHRQHLVTALGAALVQALTLGLSAEEAVSSIESHKWVIFHRIVLYGLSQLASPDVIRLSRDRLLDQARMRDYTLRPEFNGLLQAHFGELTPDDQLAVLVHIDEGPEHDDEDNEEDVERWKYSRLRLLSRFLDDTQRERLAALETRFGPQEEPADFQMAVWSGGGSPLSAEQLTAMSVPAVTQYLSTWEPPALGFKTPSRRGLAMALEQAVQASPNAFAEAAEGFADIDVEYQSFLLRGLTNSSDKMTQAAWTPLLRLLSMIATREEWDANLKHSVLHLIDSGLRPQDGEIPIELREMVWQIIAKLANDPDPTPDDERSFQSPLPDPITTAINRTRSIAIETVVKYALWVFRSEAIDADARSLGQAPEVRSVLEERLDLRVERTLAVRSVFGRFLPQLFWLDRDWTIDHFDRVFPREKELDWIRAAAWESFVVANGVSRDLFRALRNEYVEATERAEAALFDWGHLGDPGVALGKHVLASYWRGDIELADELVVRLFAVLKPEQREDALEWVGRVFRQATDAAPSMGTRLIELWEWRRGELEAEGEDDRELCSFTWWFLADIFDDLWAVAQLNYALSKRTCDIALHEEITARLARATGVPAVEVVQSLRLIVEADKWGVISMYEGNARAILTRAISEGGSAAEDAKSLIDKLARLGHFGFSDLVRS